MERNEIISYLEMCGREGMSLQRGMNYLPPPNHSIFLSSHRPGAPYDDLLEADGEVLIYEGHDQPRTLMCPSPKQVDQPMRSKAGKLTPNGIFHEAAQSHKQAGHPPLHIRVYEKLKGGIWSYNGPFRLVDSWTERSGGRVVFRFRLLALAEGQSPKRPLRDATPENGRLIPTWVKLAVWKRDRGACAICGVRQSLHFDHILPYSKGGTSNSPTNIQILCMKHNLSKSAHII